MQSVIQRKFYNSVQVFWLNKGLLKSKIIESVEMLVSRCPEVEEIILFGSVAAGREMAFSDIDILLIVSETRERFIDRSLKYIDFFKNVGLTVDLFVYTQEEITRGIPLADTAFKSGEVLFKR